MSITAYTPNSYKNRYNTYDNAPMFIQTQERIRREQERLNMSVLKATEMQEAFDTAYKAEKEDEFYEYYSEVASGRMDSDELVTRFEDTFIPITGLSDFVSQQTDMANMRTWLGPNAMAYQAQVAGTENTLGAVYHLLPGDIQQKVKDFREDVWLGGGSTNEGDYGVGSGIEGILTGWFSSDRGTNQFVKGGRVNEAIYKVDPSWKTNKKLQDVVVKTLLNPETTLGRYNLKLGLTPEDIREAPSITGLATMINGRSVDFKAGIAMSQMSSTEYGMQFIYDLGRGIITDPDTVVEVGLSAALIPITLGGSAAAGLGRLTARGLLKAGGKASATGYRVGKAADVMLHGLAFGAEGLGKTARVVTNASKLSKKFLAVNVFDEVISPTIKNYKFLKKTKHADEMTEATAEAIKGVIREKDSILWPALKKALTSDDIEISSLGRLASSALDGAGGELLAYAVSLDDIYEFQRLVYGSEINQEDFEFSFMNAMAAAGQGAVFGSVLNTLIKGAGSLVTRADIAKDMFAKPLPEGATFKDLWKRINETRALNKVEKERRSALNWLSQVSGLDAVRTATSHVQAVLKARGEDANTIKVAGQMIEAAFEQGVDVHKLIKGKFYKLKDLASFIKKNRNSTRAAARKTAINTLRTKMEGVDVEYVKTVNDTMEELNRRRINKSNDEDIVPTEVNSYELLLELIDDETVEPRIREKAASIRDSLQEALKNRTEFISKALADVDVMSLDPETAQQIINTTLESQGYETLSKEEFEAVQKATDEVRAQIVEQTKIIEIKAKEWKAAIDWLNKENVTPAQAQVALEEFLSTRQGINPDNYSVKEKAYYYVLKARIAQADDSSTDTATAEAPSDTTTTTEAPSDTKPAKEPTTIKSEGFFSLELVIPESKREGWKKLANKIVAMTRGLVIVPGATRTSALSVNSTEPNTIQIHENGVKAIEVRGGDDVALRIVVSEEVAHAASYMVLGDDFELSFADLWNFFDADTKAAIEKAYFRKNAPGFKSFKEIADDQALKLKSVGSDATSDEGAAQGGSELFRMLMQYRMGIPLTETLKHSEETDAEYQERTANLIESIEKLNSSLTEAQIKALDEAIELFNTLMPPVEATPTPGATPAAEAPYVLTKIEEGHPYFNKGADIQYVFKNAEGQDILVSHTISEEGLVPEKEKVRTLRVDFEALDEDGDMTSWVSTGSGDAVKVIRAAFSKALEDAEANDINIITFMRGDKDKGSRQGAMIYKRLVEQAYPDKNVWSYRPDSLVQLAVTLDNTNPLLYRLGKFDRSYHLLTDARVKKLMRDSDIEWDVDLSLKGEELRKALDVFIKDNFEEIQDRLPVWDNTREAPKEAPPTSADPVDTTTVPDEASFMKEFSALMEEGAPQDPDSPRVELEVTDEAVGEALDAPESRIPTWTEETPKWLNSPPLVNARVKRVRRILTGEEVPTEVDERTGASKEWPHIEFLLNVAKALNLDAKDVNPAFVKEAYSRKAVEPTPSSPGPTGSVLQDFGALLKEDQDGFTGVDETSRFVDSSGRVRTDPTTSVTNQDALGQVIQGKQNLEREANTVMDSPGAEGIKFEADNPAQAFDATRRNVADITIEAFKESRGLGTFDENDARQPGAKFTPYEMAKRTAENLKAFEKNIDPKTLEDLNNKIDAELKGVKGVRAVEALIYDEFGIDVGLRRQRGTEKETKATLDVEEKRGIRSSKANEKNLKKLYKSMRILKELPEVKENVTHQVELARKLAAGVRALSITAKAQGLDSRYVPYSLVVRYIPAELVDGIFSIFKDAATVNNEGEAGVFDIGLMLDIAYNKLQRADDSFATLIKVNQEAAEDKTKTRTIYGRLKNRLFGSTVTSANRVQFENAVAMADEEGVGVEYDSEGNEVLINHADRVLLAATRSSRASSVPVDNQTAVKAHVAAHKEAAINGVVKGWSRIPEGPSKELLAKRLGIAGLVNSNNAIFMLEKTNEGLVTQRTRIYDAVEKYLAKELGDPTFKLEKLFNGEIDSAAGYHVGRAAIEAVDGTRNIGREWGQAWDGEASRKSAEQADESSIARFGYIGTLDSKTLASLHEDHVQQRVAGYLLYEDNERSRLRKFTPEQVENILDYYDEIEARIEQNELRGWTEDSWNNFVNDYVQDTFYTPDTKKQYAPDILIRDIKEEIGNFRTRVEQRVKAMRMAPPAIVKTLHDEVSTVQSFFGSMYVIGRVPETNDSLKGGVPATLGMPFGSSVPGSFAQAWNIRSENMFPTVNGIARIASLAGLKNLGEFFTSLGDNKLKFLEAISDTTLEFKLDDNGKILKVENEADASAQAVTFSQMINVDYLAAVKSKSLDPGQVSFLEYLNSARKSIMDNWGGVEMMEDVNVYIDSLVKEGDDNYSLVGLEAIRQAPKGSTLYNLYVEFLKQIPKSDIPEKTGDAPASDSITTFKLGKTPLGKALRKIVFKPPVMTLPYSAGIKAFRHSITEGLQEIVNNPEKYGITEEAASKIDIEGTALQLAFTLYGKKKEPGLIETVLKIPNSKRLQEIMIERSLSRVNELVTEDGGTRVSIPENAIVSGEIFSNPQMIKELKSLAKRYLLMDPESTSAADMQTAGVFVLKQLYEVQKGTLSWKNFLTTCKQLKEYLALDPNERHRWRTVSSYISTAEHTGRLGFIPDLPQIEIAMEELGITKEMLSPEAYAHFVSEIAYYYPKSTQVGGRVNSNIDGSLVIRDQTGASTSEELIGQGDIQMGQLRVAHGYEGILGQNVQDLEGDEYENALRSAVVLDMMMETSSIFRPPALEGTNVLDRSDIGELLFSAGSLSNDAARSQLSTVAQGVDEKLNEYAKKASKARAKGEELTPQEQKSYAFLTAMKQVLIQRDPDTGRVNSIRNKTWIAADIATDLRINRPSSYDLKKSEEETAPTKVGIPFLRAARETIDLNRKTQSDVLDGQAPFSNFELNVASPISPEYTERVRNAEPLPAIAEVSNEVYAEEVISEVSEAEIEAEIKAERVIADRRSTTISGNRSFLLASRMRASMRGDVRRIVTVEDSKSRKNSKHKAALKNNLRLLEEALVATHGGTSRKDAIERGSRSKLELPKRGAARGRRTQKGQRRTFLSALQNYSSLNRISNLVGLMLGAVPHSNIRILNPKVDSREAKAEGKNYQVSNRVTSPTSRGPMSIFFRDWSLMGGAHLDTVKNMLRYIYIHGADTNGVKYSEGSFEDAVESIVQRGLINTWADTVPDNMDIESDSPNMLDLALFSEQTRDTTLYDYDVSNTAIEAVNAEFEKKFQEGLVTHGLNPMVASKLDPEGRLVFLEILTELSEPANLKWLQDTLGLDETYTPEKIALLFMDPQSKKNLMFLEVYEIEKDDKGNDVTKKTTWGQLINGMIINDVKMLDHTLPVFTELELLNLANVSGNRNLIRKILMANRFGIDIDVLLTNSSLLDNSRDKFANNGITHHGFLNTPNTDEAANSLMLGTKEPLGYDANEHGQVVLAQIRRVLGEEEEPRVSSVYYGVASMLRSAGFIFRAPSTEDGKFGEEFNAPSDLMSRALEMLSDPEMEISLEQVMTASRHIGKMEKAAYEKKQTADAAKAAVENTEEAVQITMNEAMQRLGKESRGEDMTPPMSDVDQAIAESPVDENQKPLVAGEGRTKYGDSYLLALKSKGDVVSNNLATMFEVLTGRDQKVEVDSAEDNISDDKAIALLEFAMVDPKIRSVLFGGGSIEIGGSGQVSIDLSFSPQEIKAKLRGFNVIKKAINQDRMPLAAYLLIHELSERMLDIRSQGTRQVGQDPAGALNRGATTRQLKELFVVEFLDQRGRKNFLDFLKEIGYSTKAIEQIRENLKSEARRLFTREFKNKHGLANNATLQNLTDAQYKELASGIVATRAKESQSGTSAENTSLAIMQDAIAHYVSYILFKDVSMKGPSSKAAKKGLTSKPALKILGELASNIIKVMSVMTNKMEMVLGYKTLKELRAERDAANEKIKEEGGTIKKQETAFLAETRSEFNFEIDTNAFDDHLDMVMNLLDQAQMVMDGTDLPTTDESSFRYEPGSFTRYAEGTPEGIETTASAEAKLAELEERLKKADIMSSEYYKLIQQRQAARNALRSEEIIGYDEALEKELIDKATDPITGVASIKNNLNRTEQAKLKELITYRMLGKIRTQRTGNIARILTSAATLGSAAGGGMVNVRASSFHFVRALGSMLNPDGVNTETSYPGYIPAQISQDHLEVRLSNTRRILGDFNIFATKLLRKDRGLANALHRNVRIIMEQSAKAGDKFDPDEFKKSLTDLEPKMPPKVINALIAFRDDWFGEKGYYKEFVRIAELDGLISKGQAKKLRSSPRLPYMVDRTYLQDEEAYDQAVQNVRTTIIDNQLLELRKEDGPSFVHVELLEDVGLLWLSDKSLLDKQYEYEENSARLNQTWLGEDGVVDFFRDIYSDNQTKLDEFNKEMGSFVTDDGSPDVIKQIDFLMAEFKKALFDKNTYSKEGTLEEGFSIEDQEKGQKLLTLLTSGNEGVYFLIKDFENLLSKEGGGQPAPWSYTRDSDGAKLSSPSVEKIRAYRQTLQSRGVSGIKTVGDVNDPGVGGPLATRIVQSWQNGGSLKLDERLFADPRYMKDGTFEFQTMQINDITALTNSLFGGRLAESNHNAVNYGAFRATGFGIRDMIISLQDMLNSGSGKVAYVPGEDGRPVALTEEQKSQASKDLEALIDQYDVGLNKKPQGVEELQLNNKVLHLLSRFGVTLGSAENWAISALAETTHMLGDTVARSFLKGEFKSFADFFSVFTPERKIKEIENINLSTYYMNRYNIGVRTGMFYLDDLQEAEFRDPSSSKEQQGYELLSQVENTIRAFATTGFGKINRINRVIQAKRAIRDLQKIASKGDAFDTFILAAQNESSSAKDVMTLARKAGMRAEQGTFLATHAGIIDPTFFRLTVSNFVTEAGIDQRSIQSAVDSYMAAGKYEDARKLMEASHQIQGFLQFVNNTINLEPRMLTKAIPKTVVEEMFSSLLQFPALALHQTKAMYRMGGYGAVTMWLLSFMLGETFYATLREMVRGKSWEEIQEKWRNDPVGSMAQVAEKVPFMGNFAIFQQMAMSSAVQMMRTISGNEDLLAGYKSNPTNDGFGIAGFGMLQSKVQALLRGMNKYVAGEMTPDEWAKLSVNLAPIPFSQLASLALNGAFPDTGMSATSGRSGRKSYSGGGSVSESAARGARVSTAALEQSKERVDPSTIKVDETPPQSLTENNPLIQARDSTEMLADELEELQE